MVEEVQRQRAFPSAAEQQRMEDQYRYSRAQAYNRPTTWQPSFDQRSGTYKRNRAPWFDEDSAWTEDFYNPEVLENQLATRNNLYPGAGRGLASLINAPGDYPMGTSGLRSIMEMVNSLQTNPELFDPMYSDMLQEDFGGKIYNPDMYYSKEDQLMGEDDDLHRIAMEKYGRENPFLKNWSGVSEDIDTTDISDLDVIDLLRKQNTGYTMEDGGTGGYSKYYHYDRPSPWDYDIQSPRYFNPGSDVMYPRPPMEGPTKLPGEIGKYSDYIGRGLEEGSKKIVFDWLRDTNGSIPFERWKQMVVDEGHQNF